MISISTPPRDASSHTSQQRCQTRDAISNLSSHTLQSESLLKGQKVVDILHNGNLYKLQATKLGKLILTK